MGIGQHSWTLMELASMCTFPGDPGQPVHSDTSHLDEHRIVTIFVALQPVPPDRGPTRMYPGTHVDKELHLGLKTLDEDSGVQCCMQRGDCVVMDSRLRHHGTENKSSEHRYLFYISWIAEQGLSRSSTDRVIESYHANMYQHGLLLDSWRSWIEQAPGPAATCEPELGSDNVSTELPAQRERRGLSAGPSLASGMCKGPKRLKLGIDDDTVMQEANYAKSQAADED